MLKLKQININLFFDLVRGTGFSPSIHGIRPGKSVSPFVGALRCDCLQEPVDGFGAAIQLPARDTAPVAR